MWRGGGGLTLVTVTYVECDKMDLSEQLIKRERVGVTVLRGTRMTAMTTKYLIL